MKSYKWSILTVVLLIALAAIAAWIDSAVITGTPKAPSLHMQWVCTVAILLLLCILAGYAVNGRIDGILIDDRNRVSLSRLQWVAWFVVLLSAFFVGGVLNVAGGWASPFPTMQSDLFTLIGLATGSAVVSNLVVDTKKNNQAIANVQPQLNIAGNKGGMDINAQPSEASWQDLYCGEEVANRGTVDVGRLQQLVTTALLVYTYVGFVWRDLADASFTGHLPAMPAVDSGFLGLLAASHAGYLAYKATPKT